MCLFISDMKIPSYEPDMYYQKVKEVEYIMDSISDITIDIQINLGSRSSSKHPGYINCKEIFKNNIRGDL